MKNQILMWCINSSARELKFNYLTLEMKFVRDILLSCRSLKAIHLLNCSFDDYEAEDFLKSLAERLPNKPCVYIGLTDFIPFCFVKNSPDDDGRYYLRMHPEEKYKSSTIYDSHFREIYRN